MLDDGLDRYKLEDVKERDVIGKGSFGSVLTGKFNGSFVVVKKLLRQNNDCEKRLFAKECRLHGNIRCKNIAKMISVCDSPLAMMLEYAYFEWMRPFVTRPFRLSFFK